MPTRHLGHRDVLHETVQRPLGSDLHEDPGTGVVEGVEEWQEDYVKMIFATDETFRRVAHHLNDKGVDFLTVYFNGIEGFGLFEFARLGVIMVAIGVIYLVVVGRWLLPKRSGEEQNIDRYRLSDYLAEFKVKPGSALIDRNWREVARKEGRGVDLIKIIRDDGANWRAASTKIGEGDILLLYGNADRLLGLKDVPVDFETHILPWGDTPAGMGEVGLPSLAPALTNAIFNATGVRVRALPIGGQLREALRA